MDQSVHEKLAEALDRLPHGFPRTASGVEIEILKAMYSPEEAKFAAALGEEYEPAAAVAGRLGLAAAKAENLLRSICAKDLALEKSDGGARLFRLRPFLVGSYEEVMSRLEGEEAHRFAHLFEDYYHETRGLAGIMTPGPALHRVLPARGAVKSEWILPYDDVAALLAAAGSFSVGDCVCRRQQDLLGRRRCSFPRGLCLSFSTRERPDDPGGITREEAFAVLAEAERIGLVHTVSNVAADLNYVCNCCGCCCGILRGIKEFGLNDSVAHANYICEIDAAGCAGCGICAGRCQVGAITLAGSVATVDRERCIGCGLCATTCAAGAARLKLKPAGEIVDPPADLGEWARRRRANRGIVAKEP